MIADLVITIDWPVLIVAGLCGTALWLTDRVDARRRRMRMQRDLAAQQVIHARWLKWAVSEDKEHFPPPAP